MPTIDFGGAPLYAFLFSLAASPSSVGQSLLVEGNGRHHVFVSPNGEFRFFLGSTTNRAFCFQEMARSARAPHLH